MTTDLRSNLFKPGKNCRISTTADTLGFFIEGESYYREVRRALIEAEKRIVIVGWDIHSDVTLVRGADKPSDGFPAQLGALLTALLEKKPDLEVYILIWDWAMVYATERQWRMNADAWSNPHERLHFHYDGALPVGCSHHQKIVVIDDSLAFTGGFDLSRWRWDTSEHLQADDRRVNPSGKEYPPFHDIQVALTGPVVGEIEKICQDRWKRGVGEDLPEVETATQHPIDGNAILKHENIVLAISETYAEYEPYEAVTHSEQMHLDLIASAENWLYLENQYFASKRLAKALADRLEEPEGPEIIVVVNQDADGWLEESTMGTMRDHFFEQLKQADVHERLCLYYPVTRDDTGDEAETRIYVHAKIILTDTGFAKIGSSNLTNRSMRVDSELDVTFADKSLATELLHELLEGHLGEPVELGDSICATLSELSGKNSLTLRPIEFGVAAGVMKEMADAEVLDPKEPINPVFWLKRRVTQKNRLPLWRKILRVVVVVAITIGVFTGMKSGWGSVIDPDVISDKMELIRDSRWAIPGMLLLFFLVGMLSLPINLFLVTAVVVLGPWAAFASCYVGCHLAGTVAYWIGRKFEKRLKKRLASDRLTRVTEFLERRGVLSIALVRVVPVAPYVFVNLAAGALKVRSSSFQYGTLLGMLPGMAAITLLTGQTGRVIEDPSWQSISILVGILVVVVGGFWGIRRALR